MPRYTNAGLIKGAKLKSSASRAFDVRAAIKSGNINFSEITLQESQRLDILAGIYYGDSTLWWAIAAASDIGWSLQAPPGTLIRIPEEKDLRKII